MEDTLKLSNKQLKILANALAWCGRDYEPMKEEIKALFDFTDKGIFWPWDVRCDLLLGWRAHYGNPFSWIDAWEMSKSYAPIVPPQAWIYDAYFAPQPSGWQGWFFILTAIINEGTRSYPKYKKAMEILEKLGTAQRHETLLKFWYGQELIQTLKWKITG